MHGRFHISPAKINGRFRLGLPKVYGGFILFQIGHFGAFLHNSYVTLKFPDYGNLVGADWMENLRWANTYPIHQIRSFGLGRPIQFCPCILGRPLQNFCSPFIPNFIHNFTSSFTSSFCPNITTNWLHHNEYNVICLSCNCKLSPLYIVFFSAAM